MLKRGFVVLSGLLLCVGFAALSRSGNTAPQLDQTLHIDIPTRLEKSNVVVNLGHLVFGGDLPFALGDINLLASDLRDWNAKGS